jgi:hypothetical protein
MCTHEPERLSRRRVDPARLEGHRVEGGDLDPAGRLVRVGRPVNAAGVLLTAGGRCVATSTQVATRAVATTVAEELDDNQQDQDEGDDPKHLQLLEAVSDRDAMVVDEVQIAKAEPRPPVAARLRIWF